MLDDSAISDSLDVDSSQRDLFLCGRHTPKLAEVRAPHCPPSDDHISLSHLPLNRHNQIRVPATERKHMIAEPLNARDVGMVHHEMRRQKLCETINIACVGHLLEKATCEQLVF